LIDLQFRLFRFSEKDKNDCFKIIKKRVNRNQWPEFMRKLGLPEDEVQAGMAENEDREFYMLNGWLKRIGWCKAEWR